MDRRLPRWVCDASFVPRLFGKLIFSSVLKTGGPEVARERWDEADSQADDEGEEALFTPETRSLQSILPDWTRSPLPVGAPPARQPQPSIAPIVATPLVPVGA